MNRETADPLPTLDTALAVRDTVNRLVADVYAGRTSPRIASGLALLLNLQLRAIETTDVQRRLTQLEKAMAKGARDSDGKNDAPSRTEVTTLKQ